MDNRGSTVLHILESVLESGKVNEKLGMHDLANIMM